VDHGFDLADDRERIARVGQVGLNVLVRLIGKRALEQAPGQIGGANVVTRVE
jgi:hypothetical protein